MKLKDVWKHVKNYNNKANEISQHYKANQVYVMDNTSCPKKVQDKREKKKPRQKGLREREVLMRRHKLKVAKRRHLQWTPDLDKKLDEAVHELGEKAHPKDVLDRMCVPDLTTEQLTCHLKNYQSQTQQASNVQLATTMNLNEERHSNVLDSGDLSANFNELFQGADIHQPSEVHFVASPSSNDDSLNRWDEWFNELLELDDFELKLC
ncbi:hypothetical protein KY289_034492 [Solanum tuberosum]|nr:hypothetical protein KY289_034492 [Solanum tuberosum]KAH0646344.1 hypothetical protein KY284_034228 [Solanum tuberosum]